MGLLHRPLFLTESDEQTLDGLAKHDGEVSHLMKNVNGKILKTGICVPRRRIPNSISPLKFLTSRLSPLRRGRVAVHTLSWGARGTLSLTNPLRQAPREVPR